MSTGATPGVEVHLLWASDNVYISLNERANPAPPDKSNKHYINIIMPVEKLDEMVLEVLAGRTAHWVSNIARSIVMTPLPLTGEVYISIYDDPDPEMNVLGFVTVTYEQFTNLILAAYKDR